MHFWMHFRLILVLGHLFQKKKKALKPLRFKAFLIGGISRARTYDLHDVKRLSCGQALGRKPLQINGLRMFAGLEDGEKGQKSNHHKFVCCGNGNKKIYTHLHLENCRKHACRCT